MIWLVAALLTLLLAPLVLLMVAPFALRGSWHFAGETPLSLRISLLWELLSIQVEVKSGTEGRLRVTLAGRTIVERTLEQLKAAAARRRKRPEREAKKKKKRPLREVDWIEVLATLPPLVREAVGVILRRIDYRIYLELHYGFDDPSLTGAVSGLLSTLYAFFPRLEVALYPKFWQPNWDGIARFHMRFRPLGPGYRLIALMISRRGRAAMRALRGEIRGEAAA